MTPYELSLFIRDFNEKQKQSEEEKITLAWLGAYFHRVEKMPSLKQVLQGLKPKKPMTPEEMFEKAKMLNAAFGGKVEVKEVSN